MARSALKYLFAEKISDKQTAETGLAIVLIFLLLSYFLKSLFYAELAIPLLLIVMIYPKFFYYPGVLWLGFSKILGTVSSKVILSIVYFLLIIPFGFIRRLLGKDTLLLKRFKAGNKSVMIKRDHLYTADDITKPY